MITCGYLAGKLVTIQIILAKVYAIKQDLCKGR